MYQIIKAIKVTERFFLTFNKSITLFKLKLYSSMLTLSKIYFENKYCIDKAWKDDNY